MDGWISIHRKMRENPIYRNSVAVHCWIECLLRAAHTDHCVIRGRSKLELKPGQFIFGRHEFAEALNLAPSTALFWLKRFKVDSMIDIKSTNKYSVVTILNWNEYQNIDNKVDSRKTAKRQQKDTNNNDNNENKVVPNKLGTTTQDKRDPRITFIVEQFYEYAGHRPLDQQPRNIAQVFKRQIDKLIQDIAPYKKLEFEDVVRSSFAWYSNECGDVRAKYLNTARKNITGILFEATRRKYITS